MKTQILVILISVLLISGCVQQANSPGVGCTQEAKICPDGTPVGRIPPSCDFEPCPTISPGTATQNP